MPDFTEERSFILRFSLEARFPETYEGDLDGYAWAAEWEKQIKPSVVRAVAGVLDRQPGWRHHVRNRGTSSEDEIELVVERVIS